MTSTLVTRASLLVAGEPGADPDDSTIPDSRVVKQAASEACAGLREAAHLAQAVLAAADAMSEAGGDVARLAQAADRLCAAAGRLTALGEGVAEQAARLRASAERMRPSPAMRLSAVFDILQGFKHRHLRLLHRAEAMLEGGAAIGARELSAAGDCPLGQWQAAAAHTGWCRVAAFQALERPHLAVHRTLAALLFAWQQGQAEAAQARLAELRHQTSLVATCLDNLCHLVVERGPEVGDGACPDPEAPGFNDWRAAAGR
jgi:methyl-accepting chemotaxis protein